ncbi:MAG: DsrE family protein [Thermodesulfobacteriota bacterium]
MKIYFDIKADSAAKLEKRLIWINETYEQARQRGVKATFIIAIRGPASFFVTRGDEYVDEKEIPTKEKIKKWLHYFASRGVPIEQCGLSAELFDIDPNDFFPQLTVVKNGYLSMAGYQNKGYAYVPM